MMGLITVIATPTIQIRPRQVHFLFAILFLSAGCGWGSKKSYCRDPILREQQAVEGSATNSTNTTTAEPNPTPRPVLPLEGAPFAKESPMNTPIGTQPTSPLRSAFFAEDSLVPR
jgi:hypothetical protein